jgi:hypothetical protein
MLNVFGTICNQFYEKDIPSLTDLEILIKGVENQLIFTANRKNSDLIKRINNFLNFLETDAINLNQDFVIIQKRFINVLYNFI